MVYTLTKVAVAEVDRFVATFALRGQPLRRRNGSRGARLFRALPDGKEVVVLIAWESQEAFEAFLKDPDVPASMQASGVSGRPEFVVMEELAGFPA